METPARTAGNSKKPGDVGSILDADLHKCLMQVSCQDLQAPKSAVVITSAFNTKPEIVFVVETSLLSVLCDC